jgi:hypothetical protein
VETSEQILTHLFGTHQIELRRGTLFDTSPGPMPDSLDVDRVEGMMLGLAIGDALGATTEDQLPQKRRAGSVGRGKLSADSSRLGTRADKRKQRRLKPLDYRIVVVRGDDLVAGVNELADRGGIRLAIARPADVPPSTDCWSRWGTAAMASRTQRLA